jgi:hypothetical protein
MQFATIHAPDHAEPGRLLSVRFAVNKSLGPQREATRDAYARDKRLRSA